MKNEDKVQKLIDICFDLVLTITDPKHVDIFKVKSQEEKAKWVASQLEACGFPTHPIGSSHGVYIPDPEELKKYRTKKFYRVSNTDTDQGLWYDRKGHFTGLIHKDFNFCKNTSLQMQFHDELLGYLSATDCIEDLLRWFTEEDIENLQKHGYYIHEYETDDYKWYDRFEHWAIKEDKAKLVRRIEAGSLREYPCSKCFVGNSLAVSAMPNGSEIFECDYCGHEETFP